MKEWLESPSTWRFRLVVFILTASFLHHLLTITLLPGLLAVAFFQRKKLPSLQNTIITLLIAASILIIIHALFFLRLQMNPPYMDGGAMGSADYISYILGGDYRTILIADESALSWLQKCGALCVKLIDEWNLPVLSLSLFVVGASVSSALMKRQFVLSWFLVFFAPYEIRNESRKNQNSNLSNFWRPYQTGMSIA